MSDFYVEELPRSATIHLSSSSTSGQVTLIPQAPVPIPSDLGLDPELYNVKLIDRQVKSLTGIVAISSLPEAEMPALDDLDSRLAQAMQVRDWAWRNGRKELEFYKRVGTTDFLKAKIPCINIQPYLLQDFIPFMVELKLLPTEELRCQVKDAGYGMLSGSDYIVIDCQWTEIIAISKTQKWLTTTTTNSTGEGGTIDLGQILNFTKLANNLPIDVADWASLPAWTVTSSFNTSTNPTVATCLLNGIYNQYAYVQTNYLNAWLQIDFKGNFVTQKIAFNVSHSTYTSNNLDIAISADGVNFTNIATGVAQASEINLTSNTTKARYLRITNKSASLTSGWVISELRVFGNY